MNDAERHDFEHLLDQRETELRDAVQALRTSLATPDGGTGSAVRDAVEDGDARMMASTDIAQERRLEQELQDVLHAKDRMRSGDYGRCEACDEDIPVARLRARPEARFCIRHEEAWEKAHPGGSPVQA